MKLTPNNYPSWLVQFHSLFLGQDLLGYLEGRFLCPSSSTITKKETWVQNPIYSLWIQQDSLLLHVICAPRFEVVIPRLCYHDVSSSMDQDGNFANWSKTQIMGLKDKLTFATKGDKITTKQMHMINSTINALSLINVHNDDNDLQLYVLFGLRKEYKDVWVCNCQSFKTFEELHDQGWQPVLNLFKIILIPVPFEKLN